ncbi:hypothetical protein [Candidatus Manganitrophus noduliformans]|uniref:Uncharacterized protein n=1 Tax=Candidatus Manganitrophus noduliformans TaxID=2606439 RepID=A0A7X6DUE1_9BACT|nr:hypothetical protein [Candidatus Manganitrophus noduliformans]NKE73592.1 hypothetical protein [Candidatus Manganitrophus noduliformans]
MFYRKKNQPRFRMALACLAVYLLLWVGSAQGLTLVSMLMDSSHQTFLSGKSDQVRLIFHHSGYQDEHESFPGHPAKDHAGLLDRVLAGGMGESSVPDHEFYLSDHEQQITPASTAKPAPVFKILFPSTIAQEVLTFVPPVLNRPSPPPPFKISTTLLSLRATVLLI